MRPYAVETIIASIDEEKGPMLYKVDPAGHFFGYRVRLANQNLIIRLSAQESRSRRLSISSRSN